MREALAFPQDYIADSIDPVACPHDGEFVSSSDRCQDCDLKKGCRWLTYLETIAASPDASTVSLHTYLLYGLRLIEANNARKRHDQDSCTCTSCAWTRKANQLVQRFNELSLGERYRSVY